MSWTLSLRQQNALRLALIFVLFTVLTTAAVVFLLMQPLAKRATSDLAGLMVLAAQTWGELPPDTRPAFERELATAHGLTLAAAPPAGATQTAWHGIYVRELETQLAQRTGKPLGLATVEAGAEPWLWAGLPVGGRTLWLGFPRSRVGPQPLAAALLTLSAALILAGLAAWWLGRSTVAPLKGLSAAAAVLGRGATPGLLPETGPRELAALARRFNQLARQVHDLLEARTTLLAGLSHDLRTPLARMRLALEMMERRPDPTWIERLETDVEEMNHLVGDVLELARGLDGEAAVPVDLGSLLETLAGHAWEAGAEVAVKCPDLRISAPPAALRRVLGNLLANAQRYAGDGPIELRAKSRDGACLIGVIDRGPGIPQDQIEAVFRPFHRVDASRSPATGGTGLGLAIVRQLAQANGWQVWLENCRGGGLAAWVSVPTDIGEPTH
ncbi:ATP-binding protein [uncultured Thiodictyon sp.]|uniref:HAMP domain-containing sensor histidine kinase n=1 Tax=uncultured Thiodictyon sp. TaxID=1846217 RepID=UPI0025F8E349|nr:ATP-binding protein [uncultured Thiodictyon sp.]